MQEKKSCHFLLERASSCIQEIITIMLNLFEIELAFLYIIDIVNSSHVEKMFLEKSMHSHAYVYKLCINPF